MVDRGQVQHVAESVGKREDEGFIRQFNARVANWHLSSQEGSSASGVSAT